MSKHKEKAEQLGIDLKELQNRIRTKAAAYDTDRAASVHPDWKEADEVGKTALRAEVWGVKGGKPIDDDTLETLTTIALNVIENANNTLASPKERAPLRLVLFGTSGAGKTTITRALALTAKQGTLTSLGQEPLKTTLFSHIQALHDTTPTLLEQGPPFPLNKNIFTLFKACGYDPENHVTTFHKIRAIAVAAAKEAPQEIFQEMRKRKKEPFDIVQESLLDPTPDSPAHSTMLEQLKQYKQEGTLILVHIEPIDGLETAIAHDIARKTQGGREVGADTIRTQHNNIQANLPTLTKHADYFYHLSTPQLPDLQTNPTAETALTTLLSTCQPSGKHTLQKESSSNSRHL